MKGWLARCVDWRRRPAADGAPPPTGPEEAPQSPQAPLADAGREATSDFPVGSAAAKFLAACEDASRAWYGTNLLGKIRAERIEASRSLLREGDAAGLAEHLIDLAGPLHPGDPQRAREPWVRTAVRMSGSAAEAILLPAVERRDAQRSASRGEVAGAGAQTDGFEPLLDVPLVKDWCAHWIHHGDLPAEARDTTGAATRIAQVLREAGRAHDSRADEAWFRLAVLAPMAPALESLHVMAKVSEGLLASLRAAAAHVECGAGEGALRADAAGHPMARGGEDDADTEAAFRRARDRAAR